jgi:hypothetical protein
MMMIGMGRGGGGRALALQLLQDYQHKGCSSVQYYTHYAAAKLRIHAADRVLVTIITRL